MGAESSDILNGIAGTTSSHPVFTTMSERHVSIAVIARDHPRD
jgi:hypothetical protein